MRPIRLDSVSTPAPATMRPGIFARPFFEDKNRAFWMLQAAGWTGYLLLRSVSSISNLSFLLNPDRHCGSSDL